MFKNRVIINYVPFVLLMLCGLFMVHLKFGVNSVYYGYLNVSDKSSVTGIENMTKKEFRNFTTCSEEAENVGDHQKIISYAFANHKKINGYWIGLNQILKSISVLYPGWQVRIYARKHDIEFLKKVVNKTDFLFYCDVNRLPPPLFSVEKYPLRMWRFATLGDPQVDLVLFRDSDSEIMQREVDAVNEWLHSNKTLHIMRDHPRHGGLILAGMFGLKMNSSNRNQLRLLRDEMFKSGYAKRETSMDQSMLTSVLWPAFKEDFLAHDSYCCETFKGSSPWPTKRDHLIYVGAAHYRNTGRDVSERCPVICRPPNHLDWDHC